jgi:membrane protein required for colicin V production
MSLVDILVLIILLIFALAGVRRGVIWELFTAVGLLLGFGMTYYYRFELMDLVVTITRPGWERQWGGALLFLVFFLVIYLGFAAVGRFLHNKLKKPALVWIDRILGVPAGILKGAVLIGLLVLAAHWFDGGGRVRNFLYESRIISWGKHATWDLIHWEARNVRKLV